MFFDEVTKSLKQDLIALKNFSYLNVANKGLQFYGKNIIEIYNTCKIVLRCNKNKLFILGQNLKIEKMDQSEICVVGEIFCISDREVSLC